MVNVTVIDTAVPATVVGEAVTFTVTMNRMQNLTRRVEDLSRQAETYFWQTRYNDLAINSLSYARTWLNKVGDVTGIQNSVTGAQQLSLAALPMLDEILERLHYVCGLEYLDPPETYVPLGDDPGDTSWDVSTATQTFYQSTVSTVCTGLRSLFQQLDAWSKSTSEFESIAVIQAEYARVLPEVYARARVLVNQLGPLWAPVICNYTPYVLDTVETKNNAELLFPDTCVVSTVDTHRLEVSFWCNGVVIPASDLLKIASGNAAMDAGAWTEELATWCAVPTDVLGTNTVYRSQGGLCYMETMQGTDAPDTGVYEILAIGDTLILNNERVALVAVASSDSNAYDNTTFQFRFLRKHKELADDDPQFYVNVQYRAKVCDAAEDPPTAYFALDEDQLKQNFSLVFADVVNEHVVPSLTKTSLAGASLLPVWRKYDVTVHDGTLVHMGQMESNVAEDTAYIAGLIEGLGIEGTVYTFAVSGTDLYVGGSFYSVNGLTDYHNLAKFTLATGDLDETFLPDIDGAVYALIVAGTDLFVGGSFTSVGSAALLTPPAVPEDYKYLARFTLATGLLVDTFLPDFNSWVFALALNVNTTGLYVGGTFTYVDGNPYGHLAKINISTNELDSAWNKNFYDPVNCWVRTLAVDTADNLFVGGNFTQVSGNATQKYLCKFGSDGTLITAWTPGLNDRVNVLHISDDYLYVGGKFTKVDDGVVVTPTDHFRLVRFGTLGGTPVLDESVFVTAIDDGAVSAITVWAGVVYAGGSWLEAHSTPSYRYCIAYVLDTGGYIPVATFLPHFGDAVCALGAFTDVSTFVYIGGRFTNVAGVDKGCAVLVDDAGAVQFSYGVPT